MSKAFEEIMSEIGKDNVHTVEIEGRLYTDAGESLAAVLKATQLAAKACVEIVANERPYDSPVTVRIVSEIHREFEIEE